MDGISSGPKEEAALRVVVRMPPQHIIRGVSALPQGPGLGGPGGLPLASPSRGLTCFWPGLVGLEAAGILPGVQQGQREARLEGAGRSRFPGVQGKGAGFPEAGDLGSGAEGREVGGATRPLSARLWSPSGCFSSWPHVCACVSPRRPHGLSVPPPSGLHFQDGPGVHPGAQRRVHPRLQHQPREAGAGRGAPGAAPVPPRRHQHIRVPQRSAPCPRPSGRRRDGGAGPAPHLWVPAHRDGKLASNVALLLACPLQSGLGLRQTFPRRDSLSGAV